MSPDWEAARGAPEGTYRGWLANTHTHTHKTSWQGSEPVPPPPQLVTWAEYERFLERRLAVAESRAQNSYHCRTADCLGWCVYEDDVNEFRCPICWALNCLVCKVGPAGDASDLPPWLGLGARQSGGTLAGGRHP